MRIVFAGTPEFSVPALKALLSSAHELTAVYTQPDRPAGRGRRLTASPVKEYAINQGLSVFQPAHLKDKETIKQLAELKSDVMVVVAYGIILPADALQLPKFGCLNIHASLLPRWRGAAPIQRAIEAGDSKTGVTIMQMDEGLDTGDMLLHKEIDITESDTAGELHDRLAQAGGKAIIEALEQISNGCSVATPQDVDAASYATKLTKHEARLDWSGTAISLHRQIRAFNPWPVATTSHAGKRLRLWNVGPLPSATPTPADAPAGTIIDINKYGIHVQTGNGRLILTRLQAEGGRAVDAASFVNGYPLKTGDCFE